MIGTFRQWLNDRTGYRRLLAPIRRRRLPDGPRWTAATGSCLLWLLVIEGVTGLLLMSTYSPSVTNAWASVHYIDQAFAGSFLRGMHYWTAQALIVAFAAHTIRVLVTGAFRAPHELVWITGLLLIPLLAVWAVTGNPLSGSQKGFAQIEVEGNIIGSTPVLGPLVQRILIGGERVGNLTLTHLYALHVAVLPLLVGLVLAVHISQIYRHGLARPRGARGQRSAKPYWPYQTVRNLAVFGVVFALVAALAWKLGAPLDAPADPELPHIPRPEWYFLFLFELRAYFVGQWEFIATVVIPSAVLLVLLALPLIDRACSPRISLALRYVIVVVGMGAWATLTWMSARRDQQDEQYLASAARSAALAVRARQLADHRAVPPEGAAVLLREDPKTQGPVLFAQHCASCHSHADEHGQGIPARQGSASNLYRFATVEWLTGLLSPEKISGPEYFGHTQFSDGEMVSTIVDLFDAAENPADKAKLRDQLRTVAKTLAWQAGLASEDEIGQAQLTARGTELITDELGCTDCHRFYDEGDLGAAPDLTGYGSRKWLLGMISNPSHERFYGDRNDRMPAFAASAEAAEGNLLSADELGLLVDWLRGQWYQPEPSATLAGP